MARMRATLAGERQPLRVRALARRPAGEPALALLDNWAIVADIVAFYSERIAQEGYLCTATELRSVEELARFLGHELRPGVSAEAEIAFSVEETDGAPPLVKVPRGMPVQSIPRQDELPQIFETDAELEARAVWNAMHAVDRDPQLLRFDSDHVWLADLVPDVRPGDGILVVGDERWASDSGDGARRWAFRRVKAVLSEPQRRSGWSRLELAARESTASDPVADEGVKVLRFTERCHAFGWNAPQPALMTRPDGTEPPESSNGDWDDIGVPSGPDGDIVEIDGDNPRITPGSWIVLESATAEPALFKVLSVAPSGAARFGLSGRTTNVRVDNKDALGAFERRGTLAHCVPVDLPAGHAPRIAPLRGPALQMHRTTPLPPPGRLVLVQGHDVCDGTEVVEVTRVVVSERDTADATAMTVKLEDKLTHALDPASVVVHGNVVTATHGETVTQVLGSGDGRGAFPRLSTRRGPLTYVRAATAEGAAGTLTVHVDGAEWREVPSLKEAGPHDRVFTVRNSADGTAHAVFGDGVHGARLPTGAENVTAVYRVGTGVDGAVAAGQLSLLPQRPFGIQEATNPAPSHDWAPREEIEDMRRNASLRLRTLDRVVSVRDHEDFARGFAGVGNARADVVWDGQRRVVVVSLTGTDGADAGEGLIDALGTALAAVRNPGAPLVLLRGQVLPFGVRVGIHADHAFERDAVSEAVTAALARDFGAARHAFAAPVTAAAVLLSVRTVPGVIACTMPRLRRLPVVAGTSEGEVLTAAPALYEKGMRAAELLSVEPDAVETEVMAP
ncbi:hypothetical protein ACFYNL_05890 [Streptomyces sp. NPDC007808]|uniref:hypothetical protein n=1 Tax=Streptomyces sp. NPDC007808 TaxID=3364779 RepID=UPI0036811D50